MKKKILLITISIVLLAVIIIAVLFLNSPASVSDAEKNEDNSSTISTEQAEEESNSVGTEENTEIGIPNPWSDASSADEAAKGAGLNSFVIPEYFSCFSGDYQGPALRYMDGLAEAVYGDGTNSLVVRKGSGNEDVSGDYNTYTDNWEINWKGLPIQCSGANGEVKLARWYFGDNAYSLSFNSGESELPGLSESDVTSIVNQIS